LKDALSLAQARRIALAAQGFARSRPEGKANWTRMARAIEAMHLLQIDSVNVLTRSHYLPVFSRVGAYDQAALDRRTHGRRHREFFEYWAHEASFLPLRFYPLFRWKMERARRGAGKYKSLMQWAKENRAYVKSVLVEIRDKGALGISGLADAGGRSGSWWGWSKGKFALEYLFDTGELTAATRDGFERIYDLPERVIPETWLNRPALPEREAIRALIDQSGEALGLGTETDLRDYFRLPVAETKVALQELVEAGQLKLVAVEGWKQQAYLHAKAAMPRKIAASALVSPFDPTVWERDRAERLFGFRYRIEIYTPGPKRVFGYYVLPFLMGDRFAARVCLKADRQAGMLRVNTAHREPHADEEETVAALARELQRMAPWLGLKDIAIASKGDLASALKRAIG
jgi:uncharacterized protein YcaQ